MSDSPTQEDLDRYAQQAREARGAAHPQQPLYDTKNQQYEREHGADRNGHPLRAGGSQHS